MSKHITLKTHNKLKLSIAISNILAKNPYNANTNARILSKRIFFDRLIDSFIFIPKCLVPGKSNHFH